MVVRPGRFVNTGQEIAGNVDSASEPTSAPAVALPKTGEKFTDEELGARFNVPVWGGIRVSREKKCIVLVDLAVRSGYEDVDRGRTISYVGQNSDREGIQNQELLDGDIFPTPSMTEPVDPCERRMQAASNNLALGHSKRDGYTVLFFTREWRGGDLRFDSRVECDAHDFEVEQKAGRQPRVVIKFNLRRVDGMPRTADGGAHPAPDHQEAPAGGTGTATGGAAARRGGGGGAVRGAPGRVGSASGGPGGVQQVTGGPPHAGMQFEVPRHADRSVVALLAPREVHARPELDDDHAGSCMRDAIERGGYRAALKYYGSDESKKLDTPWLRLRTRGWLLGRLGLYGQMGGWLEEVSEWDDFDHILAAVGPVQRAAYRTPAPWLQTPTPMPRSADYIMTLEPAAPACRDTGAVPDYIWTAMLILDAAGPICSHAGLGAASFLVGTGAALRAHGPASGDSLYDPCRGARLHGAPEGCHRWIIADIDFDPRPPNEPHYYYDLTDEGRDALASVRSSGAPWTKATEAAASGLGGMTLPDLLENACRFGVPAQGLDKTRADLGRLVDAWRARDSGSAAPPVGAEDRVLVDLASIAGWSENGETVGSSLDYLLHLMTIINSTRAIACEAAPSSRDEVAVMQALTAAIQGLCRKHARDVTAAMSGSAPPATGHGGPAGRWDGPLQQPLYADVTPAMISDLYYCLAEYCKSRRLAVDPCSLPLSEVLTEDERAAAIKVLEDDSVFHHGAD